MIEEEAQAPPTMSIDDADQAIAALRGLGTRPVEEHVAMFEAVHATLRAALNQPG